MKSQEAWRQVGDSVAAKHVDPKLHPPPRANFNGLGLFTPAFDIEALQKLVKSHYEDFRRKWDRRLIIVEVGSWVGRTALSIHDVAPHSTVFCVDHFRGTPTDTTGLMAQWANGEVLDVFCENVGDKLLRSIYPLVGDSQLWARRLPFEIDVLFLDAGHTYPEVLADYQAWGSKVRHNGLIIGHDHSPTFPGVVKLVREARAEVIDGTTIWWKRRRRGPKT